MNYKKIYENLILRAKTRTLDSYTEKHHIVPRCMGGTDDEENLVRLTPEEHYLAHQLLIKIYNGNYKLVKAASMMIPNRQSNKMYGWLRRRLSEAKSVEQKGKNNSQYGTIWIHNPLTKENKKIKGVPKNGWLYGKYKEPKKIKVSKKEIKKQEYIKLYTEYYEIYARFGFEKFVEQTGYKFSKPNLVQMFAKYVDGFVPQNGKKRN